MLTSMRSDDAVPRRVKVGLFKPGVKAIAPEFFTPPIVNAPAVIWLFCPRIELRDSFYRSGAHRRISDYARASRQSCCSLRRAAHATGAVFWRLRSNIECLRGIVEGKVCQPRQI